MERRFTGVVMVARFRTGRFATGVYVGTSTDIMPHRFELSAVCRDQEYRAIIKRVLQIRALHTSSTVSFPHRYDPPLEPFRP